MSTGGVNNVRRKVEAAFASWLVSQFGGGGATACDVYRSKDLAGGAARVAMPHIAVSCRTSRPFSADLDATSGATNRVATVALTIRSAQKDETDGGGGVTSARDVHDELVGLVMDALHVDGLVDLVNVNAPAGVVIEQIDLPVDEESEGGGLNETTISFDVRCYGIAG